MPSIEDTPEKVSNVTLPYKTDDQDILQLIEAIKRKPDNEKAIKEIYNKSNFETSRKTLEILGILDNQLIFSSAGKEFAIEKDNKRKEELFLQFFLSYTPYGHYLESISQTGDLSTTETETIKDYWWKHNYGSSGSNREDGVVAFGKLISLTGLGKFITGRKGQPSRIEWNQNAKSLIDAACNSDKSDSTLEEQSSSIDSEQIDVSDSTSVFKDYPSVSETPAAKSKSHVELPSLGGTTLSVIPTTISINVDMSEWGTSKIITFFKATYGIFDDDRESDLSTTCSQSISESSDGYSDL
ncbi:MAG: hypothetical protein HWQ41_09335 [Nostoc sp. NOS(2021)]|uniref:hypothetical protein n=1 Tax=Nostoc sp. NOS(2021) TaxID=2815407 RepID=UPI0025DFC477|nr:hypothetical protein [Nostoc sp. NOS(2021)]MBN3895451.1 hypothetical protein [Nostoc sp. NOS(2021)]